MDMTDEEVITLAKTKVSPMFANAIGKVSRGDDNSIRVSFTVDTVIGKKSSFVTIKDGEIVSAGATG